jgi:hypothetical protein
MIHILEAFRRSKILNRGLNHKTFFTVAINGTAHFLLFHCL